MTKSKSEKERFWNERKTNQQPHEKVKSFKELDKETKWYKIAPFNFFSFGFMSKSEKFIQFTHINKCNHKKKSRDAHGT